MATYFVSFEYNLMGSIYVEAESEEEAKEARRAAEILGGALVETIPVSLPGLSDRRAVLVMKKERATPKIYPRKAGTPAKEPLL